MKIHNSIIILALVLLLFSCQKKQEIHWVYSDSLSKFKDKSLAPSLVILDQLPKGEIQYSLDTKKTLQTLEGFGACLNEMGWDVLKTLPTQMKDSIMKEFFDKEKGLRLSYIRMPIGANDYSLDWYSHNESDQDYEMINFNISRDKQYLIPYIQEAKKYNNDVKIWASPWCPPSWMKKNKHYACRKSENNDLDAKKQGAENTNQFQMDEKTLKAYSLYFEKFLKAYKQEGIDIYAVHVQNEPNSCQDFPCCVWTSAGLNEFIGKYLGPGLSQSCPNTEIWLGTIERPSFEKVDSILKDQESSKYIKGVGFQWAGKDAIPEVHKQYPNMKKMETESECGNGSNDWAAAFHTFDLINHYLSNGANVYMYWNLILDETGKSRWGWKQNSLVSVERKSGKVQFNPEFYLFKQICQFVENNAKMVEVMKSTEKDCIAFLNPNGDLVILMANKNEVPKSYNLKINNKFLSITMKPKSINTIILAKNGLDKTL